MKIFAITISEENYHWNSYEIKPHPLKTLQLSSPALHITGDLKHYNAKPGLGSRVRVNHLPTKQLFPEPHNLLVRVSSLDKDRLKSLTRRLVGARNDAVIRMDCLHGAGTSLAWVVRHYSSYGSRVILAMAGDGTWQREGYEFSGKICESSYIGFAVVAWGRGDEHQSHSSGQDMECYVTIIA